MWPFKKEIAYWNENIEKWENYLENEEFAKIKIDVYGFALFVYHRCHDALHIECVRIDIPFQGCACARKSVSKIYRFRKKMCKNTKNKYEKIKQEFCVRHTALWRHFHSYSNRALFWSHHFVYKCWLLELIIMLSESFSHEIAPKGKKAKYW